MAPPHTAQLAGRADWALMTAVHDALRRDLDQLQDATASPASARARWGTFRSQPRLHLGAAVTSDDTTSSPLAAVSPADRMALLPGRLTEPALWALVIKHARCSQSSLDPDQWFPVSADPGRARQEAAAAIAVCATCPVRGHCLALSLRRWDIGQHGVWGALVAADRARLRRRAHPHRGRTQEPAMASLSAPQQPVPDGHLKDRK